jgi:lysophospholipase L1-like esterase
MPGLDAAGRETTLLELLGRELAAAPGDYDLILLMGGINDLGRGNKTAAAVFTNLQSMISQASRRARAAVVLIAPWANRFVARTSDNEAQRLKLNTLLRSYFDGAKDAGPPRLLLDEIEAGEFRFWDLSGEETKRLQDDMLHLTVAGYETLGAQLFGFLKQNGVLADIKDG